MAVDHPFAAIPQDALDALVADAEVRGLPEGSVLFTEDEVDDSIHVLDRGVVRTTWSISAHRSRLRELVGGRALLGTAALVGAPAGYTATALTAISVRSVRVDEVARWSATRPAALHGLLAEAPRGEALFVERLREETLPLAVRVADLLMAYRSALSPASEQLFLALSNDDIAADLGVVARSISSALSQLQRGEGIRRAPGGVLLRSIERLRQLGSGGARRAFLEHEAREGRVRIEVGAQVYVGSDVRCELQLAEGSVDPRHCRVFRARTSERYWLEDLRSRAGTYLDERPVVRRAVLQNGASVRVGNQRLRFIEE